MYNNFILMRFKLFELSIIQISKRMFEQFDKANHSYVMSACFLSGYQARWVNPAYQNAEVMRS